jgi:hypothetical protein
VRGLKGGTQELEKCQGHKIVAKRNKFRRPIVCDYSSKQYTIYVNLLREEDRDITQSKTLAYYTPVPQFHL